MKYFEEQKKLNSYGEMFGIKRKLFETNKKYSERLEKWLLKAHEPEFTRTRKKLLEALEQAGFVLDKFEIKENFEKQKITAVIEMF